MSPGRNPFNSQDSRIASQARISTGRQRAEPPPLDYPHAATGSPVLGVNLPKTAGQKHKQYPRFQVEIGGVSFHLFPQVAGGFAFLPYAATLCGTQRMEIRCFKKPFGYSHSFTCVCRDANPVDSRLVVSLGHLATESRRVSSRRSLGQNVGQRRKLFGHRRPAVSFFVPRTKTGRIASCRHPG